MNKGKKGEQLRKIRSYVLRSKGLSPLQSQAFLTYSHLLLRQEEIHSELQDIFPIQRPIIVDIGFGTGEGTIEIAKNHPENNYIGIEVYRPGIGRLLHKTGTAGLDNIRIIEGDAEEILKEGNILGESIYGFHLFFPDPWPKKRHHKRRLIKDDFVQVLSNKLMENGYIYVVTDWKNYADQVYSVFENTPSLAKDEWSPDFSRPVTKFEKKGREKNHRIYEFYYRKTKKK